MSIGFEEDELWRYCESAGLYDCTKYPCHHIEHFCGTWNRPCFPVGGLYVQERFEAKNDFSFISTQRAAYTPQQCTEGLFFLEIGFSGNWRL